MSVHPCRPHTFPPTQYPIRIARYSRRVPPGATLSSSFFFLGGIRLSACRVLKAAYPAVAVRVSGSAAFPVLPALVLRSEVSSNCWASAPASLKLSARSEARKTQP